MNIFDALKNAVNFSREDISSVVKDREKINAAIKGIDQIASSESKGATRLAEYGPKRRVLQSSINNHNSDIKTAVRRSEERQLSEIDKLAESYFASLQDKTTEAKSVTKSYHDAIRNEVDHDWGEARIFARIDRSIVALKEIENRTYASARKDLTDALDKREARILDAVAQTPEVQRLYAAVSEKKQEVAPKEEVIVTGEQLHVAMMNKYNALQKEVNHAVMQNSQLNNARYIQNNAKNNLTDGEYRRLHEKANEYKQKGDEKKCAECIEMIKLIDKKYLSFPAIQELEKEVNGLQNKYNDIITKNNGAIEKLQGTMNTILQEAKKLKGIEKAHIRIDSKSLMKVVESPEYHAQIHELRRKEMSKGLSM